MGYEFNNLFDTEQRVGLASFIGFYALVLAGGWAFMSVTRRFGIGCREHRAYMMDTITTCTVYACSIGHAHVYKLHGVIAFVTFSAAVSLAQVLLRYIEVCT